MINIRVKVDAFRSTELYVFMNRWKELVFKFAVFRFLQYTLILFLYFYFLQALFFKQHKRCQYNATEKNKSNISRRLMKAATEATKITNPCYIKQLIALLTCLVPSQAALDTSTRNVGIT